jgi:hypothetical protein
MHGLPWCASVHGKAVCLLAGDYCAVSHCAPAATTRCPIIFTTRDAVIRKILPMCLERPIKNPETVEQAFLRDDSPCREDETFRRASTRDESIDDRQWPFDR